MARQCLFIDILGPVLAAVPSAMGRVKWCPPSVAATFFLLHFFQISYHKMLDLTSCNAGVEERPFVTAPSPSSEASSSRDRSSREGSKRRTAAAGHDGSSPDPSSNAPVPVAEPEGNHLSLTFGASTSCVPKADLHELAGCFPGSQRFVLGVYLAVSR